MRVKAVGDKAYEPISWLLNLDADLEYAHGPGYRRSPAMRRRIQDWSTRLLGLPARGDTLLPLEGPIPTPSALTGGSSSVSASPRRILCWSPTPSALAQLQALGLPAPKAPPLAVLRRVNAREWVSPFARGLPGGRLLGSLAEAWEVLGGASPSGAWRLKSRFGFAGRGQRSFQGPPDAADQRWIGARIAEDGGLWVEPEVEVLDAFALHGWLSPQAFPPEEFPGSQEREASQGLRLGRLVRQLLGPGGRWEGAELLKGGPQEEMQEVAQLVAKGLKSEGYFGPFGIDGIAWKMGTKEGFCPLLECNARMTMAFGLGLPPRDIPEIP